MKPHIPFSAFKDYRDPAYEPFDLEAYETAMEVRAEQEIEEHLIDNWLCDMEK